MTDEELPLPVTLNIVSESPHTSIIITGLLLLAEQKKILLSVSNDRLNRKYPHPHLVEILVSGRVISFDLLDGYNWPIGAVERCLARIDSYFKRSFSATENETISARNRSKINPLGFNYHVTYPGNPIEPKAGFRETLKSIFRKMVLGNGASNFFPDVFQKNAEKCRGSPRVIFVTRLWDPASGPAADREEREEINQMRIGIITELRKTLGPAFIGGLDDDSYSRRISRKLVLGRSVTSRRNYIELMKSRDICIGSMGLHRSIGWKTGEYVAAARAIVDQRFYYEVPGGFEEGGNYLPYATIAECVACVESLVDSPDRVSEMKLANQLYYEKYGRPDRMVWNAILKALGNGL